MKYSQTCLNWPLINKSLEVINIGGHLMQNKSNAESLFSAFKWPLVLNNHSDSLFDGRSITVLLMVEFVSKILILSLSW